MKNRPMLIRRSPMTKRWYAFSNYEWLDKEHNALVIEGRKQDVTEEIDRIIAQATPVAPVSGNGTELPDDFVRVTTTVYGNLLAIWQTAVMLFSGPPNELPDVEKMRVRMHEAGAASHNGQGWKDAFEAIDAEAIAQEVFDNSPPFHGNLRCWPGTHLIATTIRQHIAKLRKAALPAPPSEANVPTEEK